MLTQEGIQVKSIFRTGLDRKVSECLFNTEDGCYVYPVAIKGEEEKGVQMVPLDDEFAHNVENRNVISLDSLPTPTQPAKSETATSQRFGITSCLGGEWRQSDMDSSHWGTVRYSRRRYYLGGNKSKEKTE